MHILLASSEVHPYSKTGGLADMVGALGKALARAGHQVSVVSPGYGWIRKQFGDFRRMDAPLVLPLASKLVEGEIWYRKPEPNLTFYFVEQHEFFDRAGIYQENKLDYPDNAERFLYLSKAVAHLAQHLKPAPQIIHLHDWQTAPAALLVHHGRTRGGWKSAPRTIFTIHNLRHQGVFPPAHFELLNLPWDYFQLDGVEYYGQLNFMKAGLVYADLLTTVSPTYAREILTPEFGEGLDGLLRTRQHVLFGVLNGVDYDEWNTINNPHLPYSYTVDDLTGKRLNKIALQKEMSLPVAPDVPLFATVSRLADQKGVDIEVGALFEMLPSRMQFVLLGSGETRFEQAYQRLADAFPNKVSVRFAFDNGLAHRIEAGADFFIMPSRYEPCGLNQMYSLRYGTIPIVRRTGGLQDSVIDATEDVQRANGIKFTEYAAHPLARAIRKALALYLCPSWLAHYRRNGMTADFSWGRTARRYEELYQQALATSRSSNDVVPRLAVSELSVSQ